MSRVLIVYHGRESKFPVEDQHPKAERFYVIDNKILTQGQYDKLIKQAASDASQDVYGTGVAREVKKVYKNAKNRAQLKQRVAQATESNTPTIQYVVDSLGKPTMKEIEAIVKPETV